MIRMDSSKWACFLSVFFTVIYLMWRKESFRQNNLSLDLHFLTILKRDGVIVGCSYLLQVSRISNVNV